MRRILFAILPSVLLAPAVAAAQPVAPPPAAPPPALGVSAGVPTSAFATLDRGSDQSGVGVDLGWAHVSDGDTDVSINGIRIEASGQFLDPRTHLGGYFSLPINVAYVSQGDQSDNHTAVGDIEGGVLYVIPRSPDFEIILRGGGTLPTAGDNIDDVITNVYGAFPRLTDLMQSAPKTFSLRASASLLGRSGALFYRVDGGIDEPLFDTSDNFDTDNDPLLRLNGGIGVQTQNLTFAGEIINLLMTGQDTTSTSQEQLTNLGLTVSGTAGRTVLRGGFYLSLDSVLEDDFTNNNPLFMFLFGSSWAL